MKSDAGNNVSWRGWRRHSDGLCDGLVDLQWSLLNSPDHVCAPCVGLCCVVQVKEEITEADIALLDVPGVDHVA